MAKKKVTPIQDAGEWTERENALVEDFVIELDGLFAESYPADDASLAEQQAAFSGIAASLDSILRDKVSVRFLAIARQKCLK